MVAPFRLTTNRPSLVDGFVLTATLSRCLPDSGAIVSADEPKQGHRTAVLVAIIGGSFALAVAVVTGVFQLLGSHQPPATEGGPTSSSASATPNSTPAPTTTSASPSRTTPTVPPVVKRITITSPADLTQVVGTAGAHVTGTAPDLRAGSIWVFDYDPNDHYYSRDNDTPLDALNGRWAFTDKPIGQSDNSDNGTQYTIVAVRASSACGAALANAAPNSEGDIKFKTLPRGCPDVRNNDDPNVAKVRVEKVR